MKSTYTNLDVTQEIFDDDWNVDGNRSLSDSWKGFTRFTLLNETLPKRIRVVQREIDKNPNDIMSKSRAKTWEARMGTRRTITWICQKMCGEIFQLIQAMKNTKRSPRMQGECWGHQRLRQHHVKESSPKPAFGKKRFFENEKIQGIRSEDKNQLYCWSSWIHKIKKWFSTNRIHEGHNAGKEQNSIVYYNFLARQVKPQEGSNISLRKKDGFTRAPKLCASRRETVVMLQKWDSSPIRSESRIWPDDGCEQLKN